MVPVKLNKVSSSNIQAIGRDPESSTLVILFKGGRSYAYTPVTEEMYLELYNAESVGQYFIQNIKTNPEIQCKQM
jgi:hypothetical protein